MEKLNVIVYGTGKMFVENKGEIFERYNVIGYSGRDLPPIMDRKYYKPCELKSVDFDYDWHILVTTAGNVAAEIVDELVDKYGVPIDKIICYYVEMRDKSSFNGQYGEDAVVNLIFKAKKYDVSKITYLELGTNDPVFINNTMWFYYKGCGGGLSRT